MKPEGRIMEHVLKINDYISVPDCATTGTVKNIQGGEMINPTLMIYEIETSHGMMRLPSDWLEKLVRPGLEGRRTEPFHIYEDGVGRENRERDTNG
jgi:hypothetical protein